MSSRDHLISQVVRLKLCDPLQAQKKPDWKLKELLKSNGGGDDEEDSVIEFNEPDSPVVNITQLQKDDDDTKTVVDISHLSAGTSDFERMHARFKQLSAMRVQLLDEVTKIQAFVREITPEMEDDDKDVNTILSQEMATKNQQLKCVLCESNEIANKLYTVLSDRRVRYTRWVQKMRNLRMSNTVISAIVQKISDMEKAMDIVQKQMTFTVQ